MNDQDTMRAIMYRHAYHIDGQSVRLTKDGLEQAILDIRKYSIEQSADAVRAIAAAKGIQLRDPVS